MNIIKSAGVKSVVVPVFNPEPGLDVLCRNLVKRFDLVIVVDDGSVENVAAFSLLPNEVVVLRHEKNYGKGRAIKTAISWLLSHRPDVNVAVFVDGDGQHRVDDSQAVAEEAVNRDCIVLGVRDFSKNGIPFRSRFGNVLTSWLVRKVFHFPIWDTQTGLRAIPSRLFAGMVKLPGERYEYEMRLFGALKDWGEKLVTIPIETIYIESNRASHFNPLKDSIKIYRGLFSDAINFHASISELKRFVLFGLSSFSSFLLDIGLFCIFYDFVLGHGAKCRLFLSIFCARVVSICYNFLCNWWLVFVSKSEKRRPLLWSLWRYMLLAGCLLLASHLLTKLCIAVIDTQKVAYVKTVVDLFLFLLSYTVQKRFMMVACHKKVAHDNPVSTVILLLILLSLVSYGVAVICFLFGFPVAQWQFLSVFGVMLLVAWILSVRTGILFSISIIGILFLTAFTFCYTHIDSQVVHYPMTQAMVDGWNPILQNNVNSILNVLHCRHPSAEWMYSKVWHILVDPKFCAVLAAQVGVAFNLFYAFAFATWVFFASLLLTSYSFVRRYWRGNVFSSFIFAALVACCPRIFQYGINGLVDYVSYASTLIATFTLLLWDKYEERKDLAIFLCSLEIVIVNKFTGLPYVIVMLLVAALWKGKALRFKRAVLIFAASLVVMMVMPYWTSWICHGSPFAPAHSFSSCQVLDLTNDFTGNADAERMGTVSRFCWAWISKFFVESVLRAYYGVQSFDPQFRVGVGGVGPLFNLLFWLGVIMSLICNRSKVLFIVFAHLFVMFIMPSRYMGFARYVPAIYAMPVLLLANVIASPCSLAFMARSKVVRRTTTAIGFALAILSVWLCVIVFDINLAEESCRQEKIKHLRISPPESWRMDVPRGAYTVLSRMNSSGICESNILCGAKDVFCTGPSMIISNVDYGLARCRKKRVNVDMFSIDSLCPWKFKLGGYKFPEVIGIVKDCEDDVAAAEYLAEWHIVLKYDKIDAGNGGFDLVEIYGGTGRVYNGKIAINGQANQGDALIQALGSGTARVDYYANINNSKRDERQQIYMPITSLNKDGILLLGGPKRSARFAVHKDEKFRLSWRILPPRCTCEDISSSLAGKGFKNGCNPRHVISLLKATLNGECLVGTSEQTQRIPTLGPSVVANEVSRYDLDIPASKRQGNYKVLADGLIPGHKYCLSIQDVDVLQGCPKTVSLRLFNADSDNPVCAKDIELVNLHAHDVKWVFVVPNTQRPHILYAYAGERGKTAGNHISLNGLCLSDMGSVIRD